MTLYLNYHPRCHSVDDQSVGSSAPVVSRWLGPGNRLRLEVDSMVVSWWIVAFLHCDRWCDEHAGDQWMKLYKTEGS